MEIEALDERLDTLDPGRTMSDESFRIRPFHQYIECGPNVPVLEMTGRIEGKQCVVETVGQRVELETIEVGENERGQYAVVRESEYLLPDGFKLVAEVEYDEDFPPGGHLMLYLEGESRSVAREQLRQSGVDPASVNLVVPPERSFSVSFDCDGGVNGGGGSYNFDDKKLDVN